VAGLNAPGTISALPENILGVKSKEATGMTGSNPHNWLYFGIHLNRFYLLFLAYIICSCGCRGQTHPKRFIGETNRRLMKPIKLPRMDCEKVCREIGDFVIAQVQYTRTSGCVVGLSGGVDSSTTAALIKRAFDRHLAAKYELVGYILPSNLNQPDDIRDAEELSRYLGIRCEVHSIEQPVEAFRATNPEAFENIFHKGNMISRVRANVLSTKAATENKIVAGTGNKDEDFGIGYYTLFGDGAVHLSPIGGLSKRLVREMAKFLRLGGHIVNRVPTAGLEPGQSDYKDLCYDYDVVELVSEGLAQGFTVAELSRHEQIVPVVEAQLAHYKTVFGASKFTRAQQVVEDVLSRHEIARGKMRIIHPPSPLISLVYE
jgi:NAD+ synthase